MKKFICMAVVASLLSACATDPYTGESKVAKTTWGTGIGTAVGAGIGALAGGKKGALIGAGIGALAGAGTGGYMDYQAAKLRQELVGTGVLYVCKVYFVTSAQRTGGRGWRISIKVYIPGKLTLKKIALDYII